MRAIQDEGRSVIQGDALDAVTATPGAHEEPVEYPSRFFRGLLVAVAVSMPVWAALIWAFVIIT